MDGTCWVAQAEEASTRDWLAGLLLCYNLQRPGFADDSQIGSAFCWLHVLPVHVCTLTPLLRHLKFPIALLQHPWMCIRICIRIPMCMNLAADVHEGPTSTDLSFRYFCTPETRAAECSSRAETCCMQKQARLVLPTIHHALVGKEQLRLTRPFLGNVVVDRSSMGSLGRMTTSSCITTLVHMGGGLHHEVKVLRQCIHPHRKMLAWSNIVFWLV